MIFLYEANKKWLRNFKTLKKKWPHTRISPIYIVKPLLKKTSLDSEDLKNYGPVSNLSVMSKLLEKVMLSQILQHINCNKLLSDFQSAYHLHHSTETALLKVTNDLLSAMNDGKISVLVLLDLSAAFDTIDHESLLHRLHNVFGFGETVLSWFQSYLENRTQTVAVHGKQLTPTSLINTYYVLCMCCHFLLLSHFMYM